ncbi:MAG: type II secretion system protein [Campylobacterota bacterium]|nr:type II secretion system protein [Campylobacterota bacterium]
MKKGFTLIELIIVVLLISIVYGLYFFTASKKQDEKKFSLRDAKNFLASEQTLICNEQDKLCYILNNKQEIINKVEFNEKIQVFLLKDDEQLDLVRYKNIELKNNIYFTPSLIFKKLTDDISQTLIYQTDKGIWIYISPYFDNIKEFSNKEEIVSFIKKRDYLPMIAGVSE